MAITSSKHAISIPITGTKLIVTGWVKSQDIKWPQAQGLTIPQARAFNDAIVRAVNYVSTIEKLRKPARGNPAKVVETDQELFVKRLLLHSDDKYFVTTRREKLSYGLYTKPVMDIDGMRCDLATAMQSVGSIGTAIDQALGWR
jgi:hypothetical protein